jgi:hypothetical protein
MGLCHIQDEPADLWRECAIIDISPLGVGIDLCHPDPIELLGMWHDGELRLHLSRRITVRLKLGPSIDMTFAGEVRNAGSRPDGIVRAGIEFVGLTEAERSIVDLLTSRAVRTKARVAGGKPDLSVVGSEPRAERPSPSPSPVEGQGTGVAVGLQQLVEPEPAIEHLAEPAQDASDHPHAARARTDVVPSPVAPLESGLADLGPGHGGPGHGDPGHGDPGHGGPSQRRDDWIGLAGVPVDVAFRVIPQLFVKFWVRPVMDRMNKAGLPVPVIGRPRTSADDVPADAGGESRSEDKQHDHEM